MIGAVASVAGIARLLNIKRSQEDCLVAISRASPAPHIPIVIFCGPSAIRQGCLVETLNRMVYLPPTFNSTLVALVSMGVFGLATHKFTTPVIAASNSKEAMGVGVLLFSAD